MRILEDIFRSEKSPDYDVGEVGGCMRDLPGAAGVTITAETAQTDWITDVDGSTALGHRHRSIITGSGERLLPRLPTA